MKQGKSFLTRLLALALALAMVLSNANLGLALTAFAEGENKVTAGELVADNYELTDAEKAILKSGYLVGDTYSYDIPTDSALVAVNTDEKTVSAAAFDNWVPTTASIVVGEEVKEGPISLTDGKGSYTYDGNAFAVRVEYVLTQAVAADTQKLLLNAGYYLKTAVTDADAAVAASDEYAGTITAAMEMLMKLTGEGWTIDLGFTTKTLKLGTEASDAVIALNGQMAANDGKLDLEVAAAAYKASPSSVAYLIANGAQFKTVVADTYAKMLAISKDSTIQSVYIQDYLEVNDSVNYTRWMLLLRQLNAMVSSLEPIANAQWAILSTTVLRSDLTAADYAAIDALVAALGTQSTVTVQGTLQVAKAVVQANLSMFDVTVTVKLRNVENVADSNTLVEDETVKTVVVTLAKDATAAEIEAAIAASGIVAAAKAAWGAAYVEGQYTGTATELPETLTEDIAYTITYTPKSYTITYGEGFGGKDADTVYYGYQLTLSKHADAAQAYDYTVNGEPATQGTVVTIKGDTTVARSAGKAYTGYGLYSTIAKNYANENLTAILTSGALNGDQTLYLRKPDPADSESLLTLSRNVLTAASSYDADYAGLNWKPYKYGANGNENSFNGVYEVNTTEDIVKVTYRIDLSNFTEARVQEILNNAIALKAEAADQISVLNRLNAYYDDMGSLNRTGLSAIKGIIADQSFTQELKDEMTAALTYMQNNNMDDAGVLKIYGMLTQYRNEQTGGLTYYYNNAAAVIGEIESLSNALGDLLETQEKRDALATVAELAGYGAYTDKINNLQSSIDDVKADLKAPNAMINLNASAASLNNLIAALNSSDTAAATGSGSPYLISETLSIADETKAYVQVKVEIGVDGEQNDSFTSQTYSAGDKISAADLSALIASVEGFAQTQLGDKYGYYTNTGLSELRNLANTELENGRTNLTVTYSPIAYTVKIDGAADQTVTVEDRGIVLPAHPTAGYIYKYTAWSWENAVEVAQADVPYVLTMDELAAVAAGTDTITRSEVNKAEQDLEDSVEEVTTLELERDAEGNLTGIVATVDSTKDSLTQFAKDLSLELGFDTIWLNGEILMQDAKLSLQTLMDAILNDASFSSQKLVDLNAAGSGTMFTTKMDLGYEGVKHVNGLDFTFNMSSLPAQMNTVAEGLDAITNYMSFESNNGELQVNLNLPEKVYEVYLVALIATGNIDLTEVNTVNNEIAFNFLNDYLDYILGTEADAETFQNTLDMLKVSAPINVSDYNNYYKLLKKALTAEGVTIAPRADDRVAAELTASGRQAINKLMSLVGLDPSSFSTELTMIKEYAEGGRLNATVTATLSDTATSFEAVVIDLSALRSGAADIRNGGRAGVNRELAVELARGEGIANGLDFTADLASRLSSVAGECIIVLTGDINGDLYFNNGAILDLNGFTVNGDITANGGNLIIVDSTLGTFDAGTVTGAVNGTVHILGGCYPNDTVEQFLKDGYFQNANGYVQNALYWIEGTGNDLTIVLNSDYMFDESVEGYLPSVTAIAANIAADLATKYIVPAALSVDGYSVYNCNFDELISLLKSSTTIQDAANKLLGCVSVRELTGLANEILDDLTDFGNIYNKMANDEEIGDYTLTTAPWAVQVAYIADGNYIDFGLAANHDLARSLTIGMKVIGTNKDKVLERICELRDILTLDLNVDVKRPSYDAQGNTLYLAGNAAAAVEANLFNSCTYSNEDYITIFTVLLAHSGAENTDAMVAALNAGNMPGVKAVFDQMTPRDFLTAMKTLNRPDDFAALASAVGVTVDVAAADRLENLYHLVICACGKLLQYAENITADSLEQKADAVANRVGNVNATAGNAIADLADIVLTRLERMNFASLDKKLGNLDQDGDGTYELTFSISRNPDITRRGYTLDVNIEKLTASLKVSIFETCLWGDANHDGVVDTNDATLILQYALGIAPADFCTVRTDVNADGAIDENDATLVLQRDLDPTFVFPAERN